MTRRTGTIAADYFEQLYRADPDPWRFRTSDYERDKYAATLDGLTRPRYRAALEVGCSIGVFTAQLARRCDGLLAIDGSATAAAAATEACAGLPHVRVAVRVVPDGFPDGRFDLIVLSEVLYYLHAADLARVAERCRAALAPGGDLLLCHWLGETDYPLTGREATERFVAATLTPPLRHSTLHDGEYRLDRLSSPAP